MKDELLVSKESLQEIYGLLFEREHCSGIIAEPTRKNWIKAESMFQEIFHSYIPVVEEADYNRRPIEFNPPCAEYCIPEVEKIMEREVSNHRAIIEILDMLYEVSQYTLPVNRNVMNQVKTLKAKLVGEG
jgi:hypothetical protein